LAARSELVNCLNDEVEYVIWDMLLIKGASIVFKVALTILELMADEIMSC
jgi:hypothetical protein